MAQQCRDLSSVLGPLDTTHLIKTMKRFRDALQASEGGVRVRVRVRVWVSEGVGEGEG